MIRLSWTGRPERTPKEVDASVEQARELVEWIEGVAEHRGEAHGGGFVPSQQISADASISFPPIASRSAM